MVDTLSYEAGSVDWNSLRSLAGRAARQTPLKPAPLLGYVNRGSGEHVQLLGPHWVLDHRMQNSEGTYNAHIEEDHTDDVYALLPDGTLVYVQVIDEIWVFPDGGSPVYKDRHELRNMSDSDVQAFDFAKESYSTGGVWGDTVWASHGKGSLMYNSKGAGLSRLLQDLVGGRGANLPPAGSLAKFQDPTAQNSRMQAAQQRRAGSEAAAKASARASADWTKRQARRARVRRTDRIYAKIFGAFKGAGVGLILWWMLALFAGLTAGFGMAVVVIAAVIGAAIEY